MPLIAGFAVIASPAELPVSDTSAMLSTGAVLSSVKLSVVVPLLPGLPARVAASVYAPSASPVGVKLHAPVLSVIAVPSTMLPILIVTNVLGLPVPLIAGFEVILSLAELPVSETRAIVTPFAI